MKKKISTTSKNEFVDGKLGIGESIEFISVYEKTLFKGIKRLMNYYRVESSFEKVGFSIDLLKLLKHPLVTENELKLVLYIMAKVRKDISRVYLKTDDLSKYFSKSESSIRVYKSNLESIGLIRKLKGRGTAYLYEVNPYYIFKGNRVNYFESIDRTLVNEIASQEIIY